MWTIKRKERGTLIQLAISVTGVPVVVYCADHWEKAVQFAKKEDAQCFLLLIERFQKVDDGEIYADTDDLVVVKVAEGE